MNSNYAEKLKAGETVKFRPRGNSMKPKINSGDLVTVKPVGEDELEKDDIVFCKVKGSYYVHLIQSIVQKMGGRRFQIGNAKGHTNGTIGFNNVFGVVDSVE
jgi:signal peptidase I